MVDLRILYRIAIDEWRRAGVVGQLGVEDLVHEAVAELEIYVPECPIAERQERIEQARRIIQRLVKRARTNLDIGCGGELDYQITDDESDDETTELELEIKSEQLQQLKREVSAMERHKNREVQLMGRAVRLKFLPHHNRPALHKERLAGALGVSGGRAAYLVKAGLARIQASITGKPLPLKYAPRQEKGAEDMSLFSQKELQGSLLQAI